jgi:hypothetical protein
MRIPAWTGEQSWLDIVFSHTRSDRILYRGPQVDLLEYFAADLKSSDHRPGKLMCPSLVVRG